MSSRKPFIVACIPAYNEELTIAKVVLKAKKYVDKVIVCDDGSTDMTAEIAESLGAEVVRHERNMGYGAAIRSLLEASRKINADISVTIDGDGQHNPDDIPKVIEPILRNEADIVIGSRFMTGVTYPVPKYRKFGIKVITKLLRMSTRSEIRDAQSGFRAYNRTALQLLNPSEIGMGVSTEILLKAFSAGLRIREVPVDIRYGERTSTHNPLFHGLDVILSTVKHLSIRHPLIFYGIPSIICLLIALTAGIMLIHLFNLTRYFSLPLAVVAVGFGLLGAILCSTAIMLWILVSLIKEAR